MTTRSFMAAGRRSRTPGKFSQIRVRADGGVDDSDLAPVSATFFPPLTRALATEGVTELAIPVGHLVLYALAAGLAGVPAGMPPARTAARLDVLEAIATE